MRCLHRPNRHTKAIISAQEVHPYDCMMYDDVNTILTSDSAIIVNYLSSLLGLYVGHEFNTDSNTCHWLDS